MDARTLPIAVALCMTAPLAQATDAGYGVFPKERAAELQGEYVGTLRELRCEDQNARLVLNHGGHYTLTATCHAPGKRPASRTQQGSWWVDVNGGTCLVLEAPDDHGDSYGFRISEDGTRLQPDGDRSCSAADERNWKHELKRTGR